VKSLSVSNCPASQRKPGSSSTTTTVVPMTASLPPSRS
jgi:hypothetical protein